MTRTTSSRKGLSPQATTSFDLISAQQSDEINEKTSKADPFAAWKSLDFWKEQGISFIPLMTGLGVTRGLGIYGWASLPIYLITANATRWLIDYLPISESQKGENVKHDITNQPPRSSVEQTTITTERSTDIDDTANNVAAPTKVAYSVVHAIPFRIRLNVPRLARDRAYARRLERLLKTDPEVTSVRMNCDAASVAITYKSGDISVSHWVGLMQLADKIIPETIPPKTTTSEPVTQQVSQPTEPKESTTVTAQQSGTDAINAVSTELAEIWGDFKPPALSAALNLMANFPLELVSY